MANRALQSIAARLGNRAVLWACASVGQVLAANMRLCTAYGLPDSDAPMLVILARIGMEATSLPEDFD
jgi:hypothetical protein